MSQGQEWVAITKLDIVRWGGPITSVVWLFFLISPVHDLLSSSHSLMFKYAILMQLAVFVLLYLSLMVRDTYSGGHVYRARHFVRHVTTLTAITGLTVTMTLMAGPDFVAGLMFTSAASGAKLPTKWAAGAIGMLEVLVLVLNAFIRGSWANAGQAFVFVGAIGLITLGVCRLLMTIEALEEARAEVARLAAAEERLRLARDIHDLLGHSLSLIAVKSELARQLVKVDIIQATSEIADIERVSRSALTDVRKAVTAYRQMSLAQELSASREILAAAKIDADVRVTPNGIPLSIENVLAWAIREGVTNVVRHAHARRCTIRIEQEDSRVVCTIENDSQAVGHAEDNAVASGCGSGFGNGLNGLRERVRSLSGDVEGRHLQSGGYLLCIVIPIGYPTVSEGEGSP